MGKVSPVRRQYLEIKRRFPNAIVMFRLGDFYEMFDEDAEIAARELDIALTSRKVAKDERVPMAGVPYHSVESYVARLIEKGYHVAICDQIGEPTGRTLVRREVTRVITPGTVIEPEMLAANRNNYLLALAPEVADGGDWRRAGIAYVDISTGEFAATQIEGPEAKEAALQEVNRLSPRECLIPESLAESGFAPGEGVYVTPQPDSHFDPRHAENALKAHFEVATLDGFGLGRKRAAIAAAGAVLAYLRETQRGALRQLTGLHSYSTDSFMTLDAATRRNLELTETIRGGSARGSLLDVLDRTVTPMGGRLLRRWINRPLLDLAALERRLDAVERLYEDGRLRAELIQALRGMPDLERLINRVMAGAAKPRDLLALRSGLETIPRLVELLSDAEPVLAALEWELYPCDDVAGHIAQALNDDPPNQPNKPGVIRRGYNAELDEVYDSSRQAREWIAGLERVERRRTGIKNLKVGFNKVFGYYIEVTKANAHLVPKHYIRKQTLVNAERYITPEMKEYEALVLNAEERILEIEARLFKELCHQVAARSGRILSTARALARLDVLASFAEVAARENYVRPRLTDEDVLVIRDGRHPVVERLLDEPFVPNDVEFSPDERILIITGPNMSGKSTYLRQVAIIVLMAQIGSFVPASDAEIGLVDRIFTRIGAQDEIYAGQSTFMVEMVETAQILSHATPRSLIVLDEIGRGTSTYDGMSIARAVVEYIHNNPRLCCKTLFATHYHELTALATVLPKVSNYNVAVAEEGDKVIFLHKIVPGGADRSYGIHVARLAGLPKAVVNRAAEILETLESNAPDLTAPRTSHSGAQYQLSLFPTEPHPVIEELRRISVDEMSPLEALTKLYELKRLADSE